MPRQARLDSPGTLHHVMVRGIEKRRIVDNVRDGSTKFCATTRALAEETGIPVYAWALMSNHVHILLCRADANKFGVTRSGEL